MKYDNYSLSLYQTCGQKHKLRILDGYTRRGRRGSAVNIGSALHEGLASWYRSPTEWPDSQRIKAALTAIESYWDSYESPNNFDDWRDLDKAHMVMQEYTSCYAQEPWEVVRHGDFTVVEVPFTLPLTVEGVTYTTEYGTPLEYGGIFDALIRYNGQLYVLDHKTTSSFGKNYFDQFKPNNQIEGYIWAAGVISNTPVSGAIINAIALYRASPTKFERYITSRSLAELVAWAENVADIASEAEWRTRRGKWPLNTGACTLYNSRCEFLDVCSLEPEYRQNVLATHYEIKPWEYEKREGTEGTMGTVHLTHKGTRDAPCHD